MLPRTPIPTDAREALELLEPHVEAAGGELRTAQAQAVLEDAFDERTAARLLTVLSRRGYIYTVHDRVRVT
ncbi:hypothetical protein [Halegenticoccus soli]|uniref:hypothetical protein n=1 Tax=Halegenticoccus soli TaxID=1985678 RepID=UPI000C6CDBCE|nr:hypothetical protein [Halegenticoccus soli]